MALTFYDAYLTIAKSPSETYRESLQATIDSIYDNAGSYWTIQEEKIFGTLVFTDIKARVVHSINSETGLKLSDDFKMIIFQDCEQTTGIGYRYKFDNYVWIGTNSDNIKSNTASISVRRCNNTLKWLDERDILFSEPCAVEYALRDTAFDYDKQINVISADVKIYVQKNTDTSKLKINDRFVLNGQCYVINGINNHSIENLLTIDMFKVVASSKDDLVNNIANAFEREPSGIVPTIPTEVRITPFLQQIYLNDTQTYQVYNYISGVQQADTFTYALSGIPNTGEYYTFTNISGNSFSVQNLNKNSTPLTVTCTSGLNSKVINIVLKGLW